MGRLQEYNQELTGIVFEEEDEFEKILQRALSGTTPTAGGGGSTTTTKPTGITSAEQYANERRAEQAAKGWGPDLPPGARQVAPTRAISPSGLTIMTKDDISGYWTDSGFPPNAGDKAAAGAQQVGATNRSPAATPNMLPGDRPYAGLAGVYGTVSPGQSPQFPSFAGSTVPGAGMLTGDRQYANTGSGLNFLSVNRAGSGGNGPVVMPAPGRSPSSLGYGPGVSANLHLFPGTGGSNPAAAKQFDSVPVSVPAGYRAGTSGFSIDSPAGPAFQAFDMPFNVGPNGMGIITQTGPQNAEIRNGGVGTGWTTGGSPAVDPFAVYGRQGSDDAATRTIQSAQIMDARNQLLAAGYSPQAVIAALTATDWESGDAYGVAPGGGGYRSYNGSMGTSAGVAANPVTTSLGTSAGAAGAPSIGTMSGTPAGGPTGYGYPTSAPAAPTGVWGGISSLLGNTPVQGLPPGQEMPITATPPNQMAALQQLAGAQDEQQRQAALAAMATATAPPVAPPALAPAAPSNNLQAALDAMAAATAAQRGGPSNGPGEKDEEKDGGGGGRDMFPGYSKGGSVATGPLGGKPDQVTNGPTIGYLLRDIHRGDLSNPQFIVGEDNADADSVPDPEMLSIRPLPGYAEGGDITTTNNYISGPPTADPIRTTAPPANPDGYVGADPDGYISGPPPADPIRTTAPANLDGYVGAPATTAPVVPDAPPLPVATTPPQINTGPEQEAALRTAFIQQQQQGQNQLRARAGLGGTTAISTNAQLTGLAPSYYTLPADFSQQIGAAQTELAGLGPLVNDPASLTTYQQTIAQQMAPLQEALKIQQELQGLGGVGDPATIQANISSINQQLQPLRQAQKLLTDIQAYGQVGDPVQLQAQINAIKVALGPWAEIVDARAKLSALGTGYGQDQVNTATQALQSFQKVVADYLTALKANAQQAGVNLTAYPDDMALLRALAMDPASGMLSVGGTQGIPNMGAPPNVDQLGQLELALKEMGQRNQQIYLQQTQVNNLMAQTGLTPAEIDARTAGLQVQMDNLQKQYLDATRVAELRNAMAQYVPPGTDVNTAIGQYEAQLLGLAQQQQNYGRATQLAAQLANYVPSGFDITGRIGQLQSLSDQADTMYSNYGRGQALQQQIDAYRNSQDITGVTQNEAPAPVIQQAVVQSAPLKAIAQSDPESAMGLARLDYALSNNAWSPATSNLLVKLTSAGGSDVQAILQGLVSRVASSRAAPPALAAAAQSGDPSRVAAAAKFAMTA